MSILGFVCARLQTRDSAPAYELAKQTTVPGDDVVTFDAIEVDGVEALPRQRREDGAAQLSAPPFAKVGIPTRWQGPPLSIPCIRAVFHVRSNSSGTDFRSRLPPGRTVPAEHPHIRRSNAFQGHPAGQDLRARPRLRSYFARCDHIVLSKCPRWPTRALASQGVLRRRPQGVPQCGVFTLSLRLPQRGDRMLDGEESPATRDGRASNSPLRRDLLSSSMLTPDCVAARRCTAPPLGLATLQVEVTEEKTRG